MIVKLWEKILLARRKYLSKKSYHSTTKVISIGNIHYGGSGKTPIVMEIAKWLKGRNPIVVSRGYRSDSERKGAQVDLTQEKGPTLYGDEPYLIAKKTGTEVWVGRDRVRTLKEIEKQGRPVILDDGFQHVRLKRDIDIVVIHARYPVQPRLPWRYQREPRSALKFADAVVLIGDGPWEPWLSKNYPDLPLFKATKKVKPLGLKGSVAAFCGIAYPKGFQLDAEEDSQVRFFQSYSDHHHYHPDELENLIQRAKAIGCTRFLTTEKDYWKVYQFFEAKQIPLNVLEIEYFLESKFWNFLESRGL